MFYLYNPSVTLRPLWFDGEFGKLHLRVITEVYGQSVKAK